MQPLPQFRLYAEMPNWHKIFDSKFTNAQLFTYISQQLKNNEGINRLDIDLSTRLDIDLSTIMRRPIVAPIEISAIRIESMMRDIMLKFPLKIMHPGLGSALAISSRLEKPLLQIGNSERPDKIRNRCVLLLALEIRNLVIAGRQPLLVAESCLKAPLNLCLAPFTKRFSLLQAVACAVNIPIALVNTALTPISLPVNTVVTSWKVLKEPSHIKDQCEEYDQALEIAGVYQHTTFRNMKALNRMGVNPRLSQYCQLDYFLPRYFTVWSLSNVTPRKNLTELFKERFSHG